MKTDAKLWTPIHGELISPSKTLQTLCESQSGSFAVQASPDFQTPSKSLLSSQPISAETEIDPKHCAKRKRTCPCCSVEFTPVGRETLCPKCEDGDCIKDCEQCGAEFVAENVFDTLCSFCYSTNYDREREVSDHIDNR